MPVTAKSQCEPSSIKFPLLLWQHNYGFEVQLPYLTILTHGLLEYAQVGSLVGSIHKIIGNVPFAHNFGQEHWLEWCLYMYSIYSSSLSSIVFHVSF